MQPKIEYPKYLFAKDGSAVLVQDKAEHAAKGADLKESPADWKVEAAPVEPTKPSEPATPPAKTYREHMAQWPAKGEKHEKNESTDESLAAGDAPPDNSSDTAPVDNAEGDVTDIAALKGDLLKAGFKETQLKKKTEQEIRELHATLKG